MNTSLQLYTSRKILLNYLKTDGYDTEAYDEFSTTEVQAMYESQGKDNVSALDYEVNHTETPEKSCYVFHYTKPSTIKQNTLESIAMDYYEDHDKKNCTLIIVMQGNINDTIQKTVKNMWKKFEEYVIVFEMRSLMFNLFEHSYVPKHIKLNETEKEKFKRDKNISNESQIPEISIFDPMAKALFMRPGNVCKIIRYNKISLENEFFRICVI